MENSGTETLKVVLFQLNHETFGVPVDQVLSIERVPEMTRVPNTAEYVSGVMNLRGSVIPVIDVSLRLRMGRIKETKDTRIIVVDVGDFQVGLMVGSANEVIDIDPQSIEETPDIVGGAEARYIRGVAKKADNLLILLNLKRVLNEEEVAEIKKIKV
ncbi:purine-binding chemotaxis protein CheW [Sporolactobacillus sp. THM7-7]|nr:purine-binding chemotaxis protein CheW [Sporolactobacillus sp. THM7-7]